MSVKLALLDRDGVINQERGDHTWLPADFKLLTGSLKAVKALGEQGYQIGVITNQSGIGSGKYKHAHVQALFNIISDAWNKVGIIEYLPLFCPHHPSAGKCLCRKPGSILIERALAHFGVEPSNAFFVGDRDTDMQAGMQAGVEVLHIEANTDLHAFLIKKGKLSS